jgi:hypothetical protein
LVGNWPTARNKSADFVFRVDEFVFGVGEIVSFVKEVDLDPAKIDHFWITIRAGSFELLRISISTWSLKPASDGFDPRMRPSVLSSTWSELPTPRAFRLLASITHRSSARARSSIGRWSDRPWSSGLPRRSVDRAGSNFYLSRVLCMLPRALRRGDVIVKQRLRRLNLSIQGSQPGHRCGLQERAEAVYQDPPQPTAN